MNLKIYIFIIFAIIFSPLSVGAIIIDPGNIPQAKLTIVVNTQEESNFIFNLQYESIGIWNSFFRFYDTTENLTYSRDITLSPVDSAYSLEREMIEGGATKYIHCASDNQTTLFLYSNAKVIFTPKDKENIICIFDNINTNTKTPVLIVPGLMGTEIKNGNELLWADINRMAKDVGDGFLDPLSFNKNLVPGNSTPSVSNVISVGKFLGANVFDYTDGLINEFKNQGYTENQDLFTFPYDWRYGVSGKYPSAGSGQVQKTNSDLLGEKISEILAQTGSDKVDVVAHSMGGLVVKKYVVDHVADNHIGKAVFVGVPNTGAPKAVKVLLQGDNFGIPWLADSEIKKIGVNMPTSYDLLPSAQFYNTAGSFVSLVDYTSGSPVEKDLNYGEFKSYLTGDNGLNAQALSNAESLHSASFDNFDLRTAGINLYAIDGCKTATLDNFVEMKTSNPLGGTSKSYARVDVKAGDGTVPLESATNLPIDSANKFYFLPAKHSTMMTADGSRQEIVNLISGSSLNLGNNLITQDISKCNLNGKAISVFSPVNIFVTDQFGNRLGLADDGSIINEIPGADFEIWGEHKFVYLPTDGGQAYTTNLTGTGSGTYTIKSQSIVEGNITLTEAFNNLPVTLQLTGQINFNSDGSTVLSVKENPKSKVKIISPTVEAKNPPKTKDECKKDGWRNFSGMFKNQGDCVSYIEKKK